MVFNGIIGMSAGREVFLGFAPANILHALSFADVLDEDTQRGYQRRFNAAHSLDFRKYIQQENSSTIPLTLNARKRTDDAWRLERDTARDARLIIADEKLKVFTQVDCQHRLGHLNDLTIELPFMCFLGLTEREEMEVFNVINSKAKGLSTSLLDFHDSRLATDLAAERPELFIAHPPQERQRVAMVQPSQPRRKGDVGHDAARVPAHAADGHQAVPGADENPQQASPGSRRTDGPGFLVRCRPAPAR